MTWRAPSPTRQQGTPSTLAGASCWCGEAIASDPEFEAIAQGRGQTGLDYAPHLLGMVARAQVAADQQLVVKTIGPLQEIVQVHVTELVDLLAAVVGTDETEFRDQDLRLEDRRIGVQARRARVAGVAQQRCSHLAR